MSRATIPIERARALRNQGMTYREIGLALADVRGGVPFTAAAIQNALRDYTATRADALPAMTQEQMRVYRKLRMNGLRRDDALKEAMR
jgi:hypothetical protein